MKTIANTSNPIPNKKCPLAFLCFILSVFPGNPLFAQITEVLQVSSPVLKSTAVYYAAKPPTDILKQYQRVILESENVTKQELQILKQAGVETFAYLSVGEVSPTRKWYGDIKKSWILGHNNIWDSDVMDLTQTGWQDFLLNRLIRPLAEQGYTGLFLDTMDSYQLYAETPEQRTQQLSALTAVLQKAKDDWPELHMIANRGFEVMDEVAPLLDAIVAESLYATWDNAKQEYGSQKPEDSEWLLNKLRSIEQDHQLEVIIIDYVSPEQPEEAQKIAAKIQQQGFTPWVSTPALDFIGTGLTTVEKPTLLILYDSRQQLNIKPGTAPFEHLKTTVSGTGQSIKLHDIQSGLPTDSLNNRYGDMVLTMDEATLDEPYQNWISTMKQRGHSFIHNTQAN